MPSILDCRGAFTHSYVHLSCHFHLLKKFNEKLMKSDLKPLRGLIKTRIKVLKH